MDWWSTQAQPATIEARGKTIGMMPDVEYKEQVVRLEEGDRLCIYSDGIPEAMSPELEEFGDEQLLEAIAYAKKLQVYALSQADDPPTTRFIDAYPKK